MSIKGMKREIRTHGQEIARQKINSVYGTMRSVTTNGTLVRPVADPYAPTTTTSGGQEARWT